MQPLKRANIDYQDLLDKSLGWFVGFQYILFKEHIIATVYRAAVKLTFKRSKLPFLLYKSG